MKRSIYLDYAATTPILPEVTKAICRCLSIEGDFGNPASQSHHYGWDAAKHIQQSRVHVAELINSNPKEIIWTSGATESNNLALKGYLESYKNQKKHIITSKIEHKAILDTCAELEKAGFEVTYLDPEQGTGIIHSSAVEKAIQPNTVLISLMMVNNEIGTLTDISSIGQVAQQRNIILHVDAAQALGKTQIDVQKMNIDLMSMSAHKIYGPKGVGALFVRESIQHKIKAQIHGGGHEQGLRSGTLATHQIVGMGEACRIAKDGLKEEQSRVRQLRNKLLKGFQTLTPVKLNGHTEQSVSNYLNISFLSSFSQLIISAIKNIAAVSSGSACNSHQAAPSHVLSAVGVSEEVASNSIRFSFGAYTTEDHIETLLKAVSEVIRNQPGGNFSQSFPVLSFAE